MQDLTEARIRTPCLLPAWTPGSIRTSSPAAVPGDLLTLRNIGNVVCSDGAGGLDRFCALLRGQGTGRGFDRHLRALQLRRHEGRLRTMPAEREMLHWAPASRPGWTTPGRATANSWPGIPWRWRQPRRLQPPRPTGDGQRGRPTGQTGKPPAGGPGPGCRHCPGDRAVLRHRHRAGGAGDARRASRSSIPRMPPATLLCLQRHPDGLKMEGAPVQVDRGALRRDWSPRCYPAATGLLRATSQALVAADIKSAAPSMCAATSSSGMPL